MAHWMLGVRPLDIPGPCLYLFRYFAVFPRAKPVIESGLFAFWDLLTDIQDKEIWMSSAPRSGFLL